MELSLVKLTDGYATFKQLTDKYEEKSKFLFVELTLEEAEWRSNNCPLTINVLLLFDEETGIEEHS